MRVFYRGFMIRLCMVEYPASPIISSTELPYLANTANNTYKTPTRTLIQAMRSMHGGTGVAESDYHRLTENGIRKFNVGTELLVAWTKKAKEKLSKTEVNESLRNNMIPCNEEVYQIIKHKIALFMNQK